MNNPNVYILTGDIQSGKTTALQQLCSSIDADGILTPVNTGKREFAEVNSKITYPMEANSSEQNTIQIGRFHFSRKNFERAIAYLKSLTHSGKIIVIDEIGPLELQGDGFADILTDLLHEGVKLLIVVRSTSLNEVIVNFEIRDYKVFTIAQLDGLLMMNNEN
jgi:nucleoside-triphosphatase THEP1